MDASDRIGALPPETLDYYATGRELDRLARGIGPLELARTKELVERYLPAPPAVVFDVGGGPGVYACWLARQGYEVHLVFFLFDLFVLDILIFCTWTPRFLVIPGTEGMPGYKDWRMHVRAHMTTGLLVLVAAAALLALVPVILY